MYSAAYLKRWFTVCLLLSIAGDAGAYEITNRWTSTKTDGGGIQRGDAITLTWSVVPDGEGYSRASSSNLIDYLDDGWGVATGDRTPDLTSRPWWDIMNRVYDQYTRVSGVTMVYEPEQNPDGSDTGMSGDIRIGGATIDGDTGGILADNSFPNEGDMRIDTSRDGSGNASFWHSNTSQLRNLISHESGHGVGLSHSDISGANAVMEATLETSFWGLQFDDIYAFNRNYGDPFEKNGGNDSSEDAYDLGVLGVESLIRLGTSADDSVVGEFDSDWVGIDGSSDQDWFRFSTTETGGLTVNLSPLGPTYSTVEQGNNTDFSARSDLSFQVYSEAEGGLTLLADIDHSGAGFMESVSNVPITSAGDYLLRVEGETDLNQFYEFELLLAEVTGVEGDVNQDGLLDSLDVDAFLLGWMSDTSGLTQSEMMMRGDLNSSGKTDLTDAILLQQALLDAGVGAALQFPDFADVPEPTTGMLLVVCALALSAQRRGRHQDAIPLVEPKKTRRRKA